MGVPKGRIMFFEGMPVLGIMKTSLRLRPGHGIAPARCPAQGMDTWAVTGNDPQFAVELGPTNLRAGWYRIQTRTHVESGQLAAPCLYADYGCGISESTRIPLGELENGVLDAVVCFVKDVVSLRFDPSIAPCTFSVQPLTLTRLSRPAAAWRMLRSLLRQTGAAGAVWRSGLQALTSKSLHGFGDWLYTTYLARGTGPDDYARWIALYDRLTDAELVRLREIVSLLPTAPKISILLPVYNTPRKWLKRCIDSVRAQAYPRWELCIADDASTRKHVRPLLKKYAALDPRIQITFREANGHISEASNSALSLATGDYVALLDHDDELPPHALFVVAKTLMQRPELKLVYSDEDKIDEQGRRFDPYFKPDWNPDLLRSQNYVCHLGVYSRALVHAVGGFRKGLEGSQDYDLALRCIERLTPDEIGHIPHVLYHWRAIAGSTALALGEKNYAADAGRRALQEHLQRSELAGKVEIRPEGYRVRYALPEAKPKVSLIVPTRDRVGLLRTCVESILAVTDYPNYEIVVVDNQSSEPETLRYFNEIKQNPRVRVLEYDAPFNYSKINNYAASHCICDIIGLINNDIEIIHPDWLSEMVSHAVRPYIGVVGAMLYYPNDTIQHAGVIVGLGGVAGHAYVSMQKGYPGQMFRAKLIQNLSAVTAACLLVRHEVFNQVGGLDAGLQVAFNDVDFCLRVREKGYLNLWTPYAEMYHHESASRGYEDTPEKQRRFIGEITYIKNRWGESLLFDPAYNPNLTLNSHNFEIASEPRVFLRDALNLESG